MQAKGSSAFRERLMAWYETARRELPWRATRDPYRIWVSEIMLQQTRAAAVVPYYERFLERFPAVEALAAAAEQELLAAWSGLGYYSRARNLHKAAKAIAEAGKFPEGYEELRALPGVGEYTAAAVASIAFRRPHAALDGNAVRVLSRMACETGDIASGAMRRRLRDMARELLDPSRPGEFNQAMMELGATVCVARDPRCGQCPVSEFCRARAEGKQNEVPLKARKKSFGEERRVLLIARKNGELMLWKRAADSRRMAGFWELPEEGQAAGAALERKVGSFRHTIVQTKYTCDVWEARVDAAPAGCEWIGAARLRALPLSTVARKAIARYEVTGPPEVARPAGWPVRRRKSGSRDSAKSAAAS